MDVLAPKNGVVQDLIPLVQRKANLSDEVVSGLRIYETQQYKIIRELDSKVVLASIPDHSALYAETISEEETNAGDEDHAIYAFHFDKEPVKTHGIPFKFVVKPVSSSIRKTRWVLAQILTYLQGEPFKDTRERLAKRTGIKGKQFDKLKFALMSRSAYARPTYLNDGEYIFRPAIMPCC